MRSAWVITALLAALSLGGCAGLPHDGPSARRVTEGAAGRDSHAYGLVDLTYGAAQIVASHPPENLATLGDVASNAPVDLIGGGDVLSVWISSAGAGPQIGESQAAGPAGSGLTLPSLVVDRDGAIVVPYAGAVVVVGLSPRQAEAAITSALRGRSINPQVIVQVTTNVANSVTVIGEARNSGRFPLSANGDRVLDMLAAAGGSARTPADVVVTVVRGQKTASTRLSALMNNPAENVRLAPRDQIQLAYRPRKFSTFGAFAKASQIPIEDDTLTLAGAVSRMGGLDPNSANAASMLLFRFERPAVAQALGVTAPATAEGVPIVYRLDLTDPAGLFVANRFEVRADDLIYVPRSDSTELRKFFDLVNSVTQIGYNVRVAGTTP